MLSGYPTSSDPFYEVAPSSLGLKAELYIADFGLGQIEKAADYNGIVSLFQNQADVVGIATLKTGQY